RRLERALGDSLGFDLELAQAMRDRKKVLIRLNSYLNPRLAPMIGGMLLVHVRRVCQTVVEPFILVIEEAGQMKRFQSELVPIYQAAGDRGKPTITITQNPSLLPTEVRGNAAVWVAFPLGERLDRSEAADHLEISPDLLKRSAFPGCGKDQGLG